MEDYIWYVLIAIFYLISSFSKKKKANKRGLDTEEEKSIPRTENQSFEELLRKITGRTSLDSDKKKRNEEFTDIEESFDPAYESAREKGKNNNRKKIESLQNNSNILRKNVPKIFDYSRKEEEETEKKSSREKEKGFSKNTDNVDSFLDYEFSSEKEKAMVYSEIFKRKF